MALVQTSLAFLGQVANEPAAADAASAVKVHSVWDFMVKGGPVMIPIGLCSLVALTVVIERVVSLRRRKVIPPGFLSGLKRILDAEDGGRERLLAYCQSDGSPIARVFAAGIARVGVPAELVERSIQEAGQREVHNLARHVRALSIIVSIAPLLGLLGTITGMITAFQTVAQAAEALGRTELLAKGIYEAMITTAAGLMVAIPVMVAYHWISAKIDRLVHEMDHTTVAFVEGYVRPNGAAPNHRHLLDAGASARVGESRRSEVAASIDGKDTIVVLEPAAAPA